MSDAKPGQRATRTIAVIVGAVEEETRDEALRAAVGLTLRNATVQVFLTDLHAPLGPAGQRARSVLTMMGHGVDQISHDSSDPQGDIAATIRLATAIRSADAIEIWGPVAPIRAPGPPAPPGPPRPAVTHLVRPGHTPACPAPGEPVLHLPQHLDRDAADRLLDPLLAGGPVAVW